MSEDIEKSKEELEKLQKERDEYLAGWQRAKADFINYKKDESQRFEMVAQFAAGDLIFDLLLVLDSFDLALGEEKDQPDGRGLHLIREQLENILKKRGLTEIKALGEKFDPNFHEAVETVENSPEPDGVIVEVFAKGYMLHGKVLRPAKVKVTIKKNK